MHRVGRFLVKLGMLFGNSVQGGGGGLLNADVIGGGGGGRLVLTEGGKMVKNLLT